jgi:hypothetical protein
MELRDTLKNEQHENIKEAVLVILAESLDKNRLETKDAKRIELSINAITSPQALAYRRDDSF